MMRRWFVLLIAISAFWGNGGVTASAASSKDTFTLIVLPARYSVVQVAFDIIAKRDAVIVSYQPSTKSPDTLLHVWNGQEWVAITLQDYQQVSFLEKMPGRVVLLGDDATVPADVLNASAWAPDIVRVYNLDNAALVNEFDRIFKWKSQEWQWFSSRYNLDLRDESAARRKSSWYDQSGPLRKPSGK